jgi:hypothetical protein
VSFSSARAWLDFKVAPSQHITMCFPKQMIYRFITLPHHLSALHSLILFTSAARESPPENLHHGGPEQELSRALPHRRFEEVRRVQTENRTCHDCIRTTLQVLRSTVQRPLHGAPIPGTPNRSMDVRMLRLPHADRRKSAARTRNRVLQVLWALAL